MSGGRAYHVVRSEAGVPALIEGASVPSDALPLAVGDGGLHGLAGTPGGRRYFGVSTSDRSGRPFDVTNDGPFRVASSHWLIGDRLLDLATGRALPLGDDVRGITFAADRASFLFQAGAEGDLYRWNAADGVQPVARLAIPWPAGAERLWITGYDGAAGDLERIDPATGDRMRLLSGFQRTLGTMGDGRSVMISGFEPNLGMGKLVALDLSTGHVEGLSEIRATLPAYGIGERLIFHGLDGGRPAIRTLSFGTGTVARVGPGELGRVLSITPDGRLMYEADGIWWAEGRDGAPAMAIDFADAERTSAVTGDGSHVLYDRAGEGTFGVEL